MEETWRKDAGARTPKVEATFGGEKATEHIFLFVIAIF
jgi:hypothetical protein